MLYSNLLIIQCHIPPLSISWPHPLSHFEVSIFNSIYGSVYLFLITWIFFLQICRVYWLSNFTINKFIYSFILLSVFFIPQLAITLFLLLSNFILVAVGIEILWLFLALFSLGFYHYTCSVYITILVYYRPLILLNLIDQIFFYD